jgi:hypothetical protein
MTQGVEEQIGALPGGWQAGLKDFGAARFGFKRAGLEFTSSPPSARQQCRPFDASQGGHPETLDP